MESGPQSKKLVEKQGSDPRQKEGQGLDFWAEALLKQGLITQEEHDDFIQKNNSKEEVMEEKGFPQLKHYGFFTSTKEIVQKLSDLSEKRFIIRCTSKENGDIKRLIDADLEQVCEFADNLPGGFKKWKVEVKEFVETKIAGTIIVEPSGRTTIETWRGPHYLNTTDVPKYHAEFDPNKFDQRYRWQSPDGATDLVELQEPAIRALRYAFPHLKPNPNDPIYIEYGVKPTGEVYFIEANDSPVLTGKSK